jgi:hypothetical protein
MKWSICWHLQEDIWTAVYECLMEGSSKNIPLEYRINKRDIFTRFPGAHITMIIVGYKTKN